MTPSACRAAVYARVSTLDQEPENQLQELRLYVEARGWTAVEYVDVGSRAGAVTENIRPVSCPRHLKPLVRISRKRLSCRLPPPGYATYRTATAADQRPAPP